MPADPLSALEREEILVGIARGDSVGVIARQLGRHRCTISREIGRNGGRRRYGAAAAQRRADRARARPKVPKLVADPALATEVQRRLEALDSPMRISIELAAEGISISHETIYRAIYAQGTRGLPQGCHVGLHLRRRRRKRRGHKGPGSHSLGIYCSIHDRPPIAAQRIEVGHLEGDLICGAYNRSAIITLFDRTSRHLWLAHLGPGTRADATFDALVRTLKRIPAQLRRTLSWDQGAEMARHKDIALTCGIDIYIADPHAPWQRPTNENGNAIVRRYVGKGTDLNRLTPTDLTHIEDRINTIPRHSLGWDTAHHTYTAAVAMTE